MAEKRARISYGTIDGSRLRVKFYVGQDEDAFPVETFDTAELPAAMQAALIPYGMNAAFKAGSGEKESPQEAHKRFASFCQQLLAGQWAPGRGAGESGPSELVLAVMRASGHSQAEVEERVEPLSPAEKRQLRTDPLVAKAVSDIRIERAREATRAARGKPSVLGSLFTPATKEAAE